MFEKTVEVSILYDFYGQLLTPKQKLILQMYYEDDYSLAEIAEDQSVTRQAVHDTIKKAEKSLRSYEEKLGLVVRFQETESLIKKVDLNIDDILMKHKEDIHLKAELYELKKLISVLEE